MSAITPYLAFVTSDTKSALSPVDVKTYSREEEFRAALNNYIADYNEYQKRRAARNGLRELVPLRRVVFVIND